jgi:FdhD protein
LASTFRKTGGVHAAALYNAQGGLVAFAEDVGRHNAVDKVLGLTLQRRQALAGNFLALTGRMTGDIVLKAARLGVSLVVSISAGINSGIDVAVRTGVTLVGFARSDRMTIYSFPERLVL